MNFEYNECRNDPSRSAQNGSTNKSETTGNVVDNKGVVGTKKRESQKIMHVFHKD
jgi:hypothetical protein